MTVRVASAVVMFIFALVLCIGSNLYTSSALSELYSFTDEYENMSQEKTEALCRKWQEERKALSVFLKHTEADILDRFFAEIEVFSAEENNGGRKTAEIIVELRAFLKVIIETEKPKIENIF